MPKTPMTDAEIEIYMDKLHRAGFQHRAICSRVSEGNPCHTKKTTYRDLLNYLSKCSPEQLDQVAQIMEPAKVDTDEPAKLQPIIGIDTVENLVYVDGEPFVTTRSGVDWEFHPEEIVMLIDGHGFDDDGNSHFTFGEYGYLIGNKTGKAYPMIKRGANEPSLEASSCLDMQPQFKSGLDKLIPTDEIVAELEVLCKKSEEKTISDDERRRLNNIQAELFRRTFHIETNEERESRRKRLES